MAKCLCGCDKECKPGNTFINGHNNKLREVREAIGRGLKGNKNASGKHTMSEEGRNSLVLTHLGNKSATGHVKTEKGLASLANSMRKLNQHPAYEDKFASMHPSLIRQFRISRFKADFYDKDSNTVIELDGSFHIIPERIRKDRRRDAFMRSLGYRIVRIPAKDVIENDFVDWKSYIKGEIE